MKKVAFSIVLALCLLLGATPALADEIPALPHAFYGTVTINTAPASDGIQVSATVDNGSVITNVQNPVTTVGGSYGIDSPPLLVQGDIAPGATITFHVTNANGTATGGTATFTAGGGPTQKNLSVTIEAPAPSEDGGGGDDGGGGGGGGAMYVETNLFGTTASFRISSDGEILETITATSADGMLTVTIPKGTIALDKSGDPLDSLETAVDESPPSPPEDAHVIGLAYDFGPDGATFDPAITFTWKYDPDALPEDVAEKDLVIAYYDTDKWVELDGMVDTEKNTITASVSHFTTFAIIGAITPPSAPAPAAFSVTDLSIRPAEVQPKEAVAITVSVTNTGGAEGSYTTVLKVNGAREAEKSVTIAAGGSQEVAFSVTKEEPGSYTVAVDGLSGKFTVLAPAPPPSPPAPAAFSVTDLSIKQAEVQPKEVVTITASLANTGGTEGSYTVVLNINGVKEDEKSVTLGAGQSQQVSFSVSREAVGRYTVTVDSLSGSFTVAAPEEVTPVKPAVNWPLIGGIIGAVIVVALVILYFVRKRATD